MENVMKYKLFKDDYMVVILMEDGGVATSETYDGDHESVMEYYQTRATEEELLAGDIFEKAELAEGKLYYDYSENAYDSDANIQACLNWLCMGHEFILDETIFPGVTI